MRTFTQNNSNYMSLGVGGIGALLSGKAKLSFSAKVRIASTTTGANDNNILVVVDNSGTVGAVLNVDGTAGAPKVRVSARSVSTDARQVKSGATTLTTGVDVWLGGTIDVPGDAVVVYVNGVADGTLAATLANATWTLGTPTEADTIGGYKAPPTVTSDQFDGQIGEIAVWASATVLLVAADFLDLTNGIPASSVQAGALVYYLKISGAASPETPTVGTPVGTITGSLPAVGTGQMFAVM